jgi:hypothetical protein
MQALERQFDVAMFNIYKRAKKEAGYNATIFLQMLYERGGLKTAKHLINTPKPSEGYVHLYEKNRLDLTVEAMVVETPQWHDLFTSDELAKAHRRLAQYNYIPNPPEG